jgi:hypothetical protein
MPRDGWKSVGARLSCRRIHFFVVPASLCPFAEETKLAIEFAMQVDSAGRIANVRVS